MAALREAVAQEQRRQHALGSAGMTAFERHQQYMRDYVNFYNQGRTTTQGRSLPQVRTDEQVLRETYRFIREEDDDEELAPWEARMAKRYYQKLFKEYCLVDLRHYKEGRVGMRWRVESEVIAGKGQFICGSVSCTSRDMLHSYEVPFSYREGGTPKQALVKVRVCPECCYRLHYKKGKEYAKEVMRKQLEMEHVRRGHTWQVTDSQDDDDDESGHVHIHKRKRKDRHKRTEAQEQPDSARPATAGMQLQDHHVKRRRQSEGPAQPAPPEAAAAGQPSMYEQDANEEFKSLLP